MLRTQLAAFALLFSGCCRPCHSQILQIDKSKLPQDAAVQHAYSDLLPVEQYAHIWNAQWPYSTPKSQVVKEFTTDLQVLQQARNSAPTNSELTILTGLIAHLAYNVGVEEAYQPAMDLLLAAETTSPHDFRPTWFLGVHQCQSNDPPGGMHRFLQVEDKYSDLPGAFWEDYASCSMVTNMPGHALRAFNTAKKLGIETSDDAWMEDSLRKRIKPSSTDQTYPSHDAWAAAQIGDSVRFTSTLCGESFVTKSDSPIEIPDVGKGTCVATITDTEYPTRRGKSTASLLLLSQPAAAGETLEDFTHRMMKNPRYGDPKPVEGLPCPVAKCLAFEVVNPNVYSEEGGAHLLAIAFASEQPPYPGLLFEQPQTIPKAPNTDRPFFFRPIDGLRRFDGTLYTLALLDANADIYDRSRADFNDLLKSMQIDSK